MRPLAILLVFLTACGGKQAATPGGGGPAPEVFPAAGFVPAQPTYVVSAHTMRDAQTAFRELMDVVTLAVGAELSMVSSSFEHWLGVDVLSADAVAGIGIDPDGAMVAFSEDVEPTLVVRLASPDAMHAFVERERERGMRTQSVVVSGVEVFSTKLVGDAHVSWAIDGDWLLVHFGDKPGDVTWFEHTRRPAGGGWVDGWKWARSLAAQGPALVGLFDLKGMLAQMAATVPAIESCARQFDAVQRVGFSAETDGKRVAGRLAFDLGAASQRLASALVPPPPGWYPARANAPIAADWNLDLRTAAAWIEPCFVRKSATGETGGDARGVFTAELDQYGVRTGRAFVHELNPGEKEGRGAIALDLSHARFFRQLIDQIPRRSMFEKERTFGVYKGKHLSVPFVGKGDYVLDDTIAIAAMGDGILAKIGEPASAPATAADVVALDLRPHGLPPAVWTWLLTQLDAPNPQRFTERLMTWSDLHLGARLDGDRLFIEAVGNRR